MRPGFPYYINSIGVNKMITEQTTSIYATKKRNGKGRYNWIISYSKMSKKLFVINLSNESTYQIYHSNVFANDLINQIPTCAPKYSHKLLIELISLISTTR